MNKGAHYTGIILSVFLCGSVVSMSHTAQHKVLSTAIIDNGCASKLELDTSKSERIDNYNLDSLRGDK